MFCWRRHNWKHALIKKACERILKQTGERMFFWSRCTREDVLVKQTQVRECMVLRKSINMNPQSVGRGSGIGLSCSSTLVFTDDAIGLPNTESFIFACCDFIEKSLPENFLWYSNSFLWLQRTLSDPEEPLGFFWIQLQLLILEWCLPGKLDWSCWFIFGGVLIGWTADIPTTNIGIIRKNYF